MEEILASIRRIIADDDNQPGAPREERRRQRADVDAAPTTRSAYAAPALERRQDEPPLSLADDLPGRTEEAGDVRLANADGAQEGVRETEGPSSEAARASENESVAEQDNPGVEISDATPACESGRPLLSAESSAAVASNFRALAAGVAFSETDILDKSAQEMLRPLLQHWLDENLPALVERLVRAEIERIVRTGSRSAASAAKPL